MIIFKLMNYTLKTLELLKSEIIKMKEDQIVQLRI